MAWYVTSPPGTQPIKELTVYMPQNWAYLQVALSAEHTFPGSYGTTTGRHSPGKCSILYYGTTASITAISSPPSGGLSYDTQAKRLLRYNGSSWVGFTELVHQLSGYFTANLSVVGTYLDGRDPSADGLLLDTMSGSAAAVGTNWDNKIYNTQTLAVPSTPSSAEYAVTDCRFIAVESHVVSTCATSVTVAGVVKSLSAAQAFCVGVL